MFRKWFTRLLGAAFMLCGIYQAVISVKLFTENHDGGSLAINLVGALIFLLVGAGASGLLKLLLKKAGVSMTALALNFKAIAAGTLVAVVLLSGIVMIFFGVRNTLRFTEKTRNYVSTQGEYAGKEIYSTDEDGTTYRLVYTYTVDGNQYTVLSNSGTQIIPKLGTEKEVRYDPQNPEKAVIAGDGVHTVLLFMGSLFAGGALLMILAALHVTGKMPNVSIIEVLMGLLFAGFGLGMLYLCCGSLSPIAAFANLGLFTLVPIMLLAAGIFLLIRGLRNKKETKS